jgi:glycosyl transferase family 1
MIDIRIVGRKDATVGIGTMARMLSEAAKGESTVEHVVIRDDNSDTTLQTASRLSPARIAIFADVIANAIGDESYRLMGDSQVKVAYLVFDSDRLPDWWTRILNTHFDLVFATSEFVKHAAVASGCTRPIFVVPIEIPNVRQLEPQVPAHTNAPVGFLALSAYHPRKNHGKLLEAFVDEFGADNSKVRLRIHSNLDFGGESAALRTKLQHLGASNVTLTLEHLPQQTIADLFRLSEIYVAVSKGEGFCLPAHEAALRGKIIVAGSGTALDEIKADRLIRVPIGYCEPAYYPELSSSFHGAQVNYFKRDLRSALRAAFDQACASRGRILSTPVAHANKQPQLDLVYLLRSFFRPIEVITSERNELSFGCISVSDSTVADRLRLISRTKAPHKRVIVGHDGGFYSIFNTYFSHLVWNQGARGIRYVLPDWRVDQIQRFHNLAKFTSFCYGTSNDGNIWARLFHSPYPELDDNIFDDPELLYDGSFGPEHSFNNKNEPRLTYVQAAELYRSPDFLQWRKWYNAYFRRYVHLRADIAARVDHLERELFANAFVVSAHVRHPSHALEQPGRRMAELQKYVAAIEREANLRARSERVKVFVATDQERIVQKFRGHFGSSAIFVNDVQRITEKEDTDFDAIPGENLKVGFQLQHRRAAREATWSLELAREVIVDTILLARSHVFFHEVSNIATAVAYVNPSLDMRYLR